MCICVHLPVILFTCPVLFCRLNELQHVRTLETVFSSGLSCGLVIFFILGSNRQINRQILQHTTEKFLNRIYEQVIFDKNNQLNL